MNIPAELPEEIIQHIQSFLDGEEAARTCLLSKSWYVAWSTRPILVFVSKCKKKYAVEFWNHVRRTIKRYKQSNLKLQKLKLHYTEKINHLTYDGGYTSTIEELIADASAMGITELDFHIGGLSHYLLVKVLAIKSLTKLSLILYGRIHHFNSEVLSSSLVSLSLHTHFRISDEVADKVEDKVFIDILSACSLIETLDLRGPLYLDSSRYGNWTYNDTIVLCPRLVSLTLDTFIHKKFISNILFRSTFLENLDITGRAAYDPYKTYYPVFPAKVFAIRSLTRLSLRGFRFKIEKETEFCSHLLSLSFHNVYITDGAIQDIFSGCTLVQHLDMEKCYRISKMDVTKLCNLVDISIKDCHSPKRRKVSRVSFGTDGPEFHKLRSVFLKEVNVASFFTNFSSRFPCLEDLTLDHCDAFIKDQISSQSLKYLKLYYETTYDDIAVFDVPNICEFVLKADGTYVPPFSFHTESREWESEVESREWESEVELSCSREIIGSSWFIKLREFLKGLGSSRISLDVNFGTRQLIWVKDLPCLSTPVVENLKLNNHTPGPVTLDLLCALFWCCRPTFISIGCPDLYGYNCAKLLYEMFVINQNISNYTNCFSKMQSLLIYAPEEIDVEIFKENEWQSTPLTKFVEDVDPLMMARYSTGEVRFRFKWGAFRYGLLDSCLLASIPW